MTGEQERDSRCSLCGGRLKEGTATVPFVLGDLVVVVRDVPAQVCKNCHEPYMSGKVTDKLTSLVNQLRALGGEVMVVSYEDARVSAAS